ncbi:hypothetical protein LTR10_003678 [Elasticomyces elasticus]|nr:hypothetical protein LTR10_003678 [Elasticomyces elasticus]KAK4978131.1 hypothetical protein LTR42_002508 [Elasticomyces elasticus]
MNGNRNAPNPLAADYPASWRRTDKLPARPPGPHDTIERLIFDHPNPLHARVEFPPGTSAMIVFEDQRKLHALIVYNNDNLRGRGRLDFEPTIGLSLYPNIYFDDGSWAKVIIEDDPDYDRNKAPVPHYEVDDRGFLRLTR